MHFGFTFDLSDIDLWNIDLLDTHLDLLETVIPRKHFVCKYSVFKTSSRHIFKTSSRHAFKTYSRHVFKTSWKRLQRNNFSLSKTYCRRLQDVLEDKKMLRWKRVEDIFKTCLCVFAILIVWQLWCVFSDFYNLKCVECEVNSVEILGY